MGYIEIHCQCNGAILEGELVMRGKEKSELLAVSTYLLLCYFPYANAIWPMFRRHIRALRAVRPFRRVCSLVNRKHIFGHLGMYCFLKQEALLGA